MWFALTECNCHNDDGCKEYAFACTHFGGGGSGSDINREDLWLWWQKLLQQRQKKRNYSKLQVNKFTGSRMAPLGSISTRRQIFRRIYFYNVVSFIYLHPKPLKDFRVEIIKEIHIRHLSASGAKGIYYGEKLRIAISFLPPSFSLSRRQRPRLWQRPVKCSIGSRRQPEAKWLRCSH